MTVALTFIFIVALVVICRVLRSVPRRECTTITVSNPHYFLPGDVIKVQGKDRTIQSIDSTTITLK